MSIESFGLGVLIIDNNWKPIDCIVDGNYLQDSWHWKAVGSESKDYYAILDNLPEAHNSILITYQHKETDEIQDFWIEMVDIMQVEDAGNMQFNILYPVPQLVGEPDACLAGSFSKGATQGNTIVLLGF